MGKHRGEAVTSKHQRVGANEHSEMLHTHGSAETIDEEAVIFYAPVKTFEATGSSLYLPGIAAIAAARLLRGFTRGTFL